MGVERATVPCAGCGRSCSKPHRYTDEERYVCWRCLGYPWASLPTWRRDFHIHRSLVAKANAAR